MPDAIRDASNDAQRQPGWPNPNRSFDPTIQTVDPHPSRSFPKSPAMSQVRGRRTALSKSATAGLHRLCGKSPEWRPSHFPAPNAQRIFRGSSAVYRLRHRTRCGDEERWRTFSTQSAHSGHREARRPFAIPVVRQRDRSGTIRVAVAPSGSAAQRLRRKRRLPFRNVRLSTRRQRSFTRCERTPRRPRRTGHLQEPVV